MALLIHMKRFLKGISRLRPQRPRYTVIWDPKQDLDFFESASTKTLKMLSLKLVTLLLLATGQRLQTISLIKLSSLKFCDSGVQIFIEDRIKTSGLRMNQPCLYLPKYEPNRNLCVASCLNEYIDETKSFRNNDSDYLFLSLQKPYGVVSKQTLSRWVKCALTLAGVDTNVFKPHSTRHASTSAAARAGVSMDIIRDSAGWSPNSATFARFYQRPIVDRSQYNRSLVE